MGDIDTSIPRGKIRSSMISLTNFRAKEPAAVAFDMRGVGAACTTAAVVGPTYSFTDVIDAPAPDVKSKKDLIQFSGERRVWIIGAKSKKELGSRVWKPKHGNPRVQMMILHASFSLVRERQSRCVANRLM
jgi:hypothetical protein